MKLAKQEKTGSEQVFEGIKKRFCQYRWKTLTFDQNRTAHIRHQSRKTTVLSCHRYLINTGVEKMN
jgi:hypothetical protein